MDAERFQYKIPYWDIRKLNRDMTYENLGRVSEEEFIAYHPPPPTEVVLYKPYLKATGNNVTAALLLDYFYYYCTWMSKLHGIDWITLSIANIKDDFTGAFSEHVINKALNLLVELNLLHRRPDPNDPMNRSRQYLVNFEALQALKEHL
jgi:hypothetical protein